MQRIATFAAVCVTLKQLDGPPTLVRKETPKGIGLTTNPDKSCNSESFKLLTFRDALLRDPWLSTYFQLGSQPRDLTKWRAADVEADDVMLCPAILLKKWESKKTSTPEAKSLWRGVLSATQPEFRSWLILMLRGTLTEEIGGSIARFKFYSPPKEGEDDRRPARVREAADLGLRLVVRSWNELTETYKGQPLEFITPDGKYGFLDLGCKTNPKPYWLGIGQSHSYPEMLEMYS